MMSKVFLNDRMLGQYLGDTMRICMLCDKMKQHDNFWRKSKSCLKCNHQIHNSMRRKCLMIYGNKCQECGYTMPVCLCFHHINKNEGKERSRQVYRRIIKAKKPVSEIALLCANCHKLADIFNNSYRKVYERK